MKMLQGMCKLTIVQIKDSLYGNEEVYSEVFVSSLSNLTMLSSLRFICLRDFSSKILFSRSTALYFGRYFYVLCVIT